MALTTGLPSRVCKDWSFDWVGLLFDSGLGLNFEDAKCDSKISLCLVNFDFVVVGARGSCGRGDRSEGGLYGATVLRMGSGSIGLGHGKWGNGGMDSMEEFNRRD